MSASTSQRRSPRQRKSTSAVSHYFPATSVEKQKPTRQTRSATVSQAGSPQALKTSTRTRFTNTNETSQQPIEMDMDEISKQLIGEIGLYSDELEHPGEVEVVIKEPSNPKHHAEKPMVVNKRKRQKSLVGLEDDQRNPEQVNTNTGPTEVLLLPALENNAKMLLNHQPTLNGKETVTLIEKIVDGYLALQRYSMHTQEMNNTPVKHVQKMAQLLPPVEIEKTETVQASDWKAQRNAKRREARHKTAERDNEERRRKRREKKEALLHEREKDIAERPTIAIEEYTKLMLAKYPGHNTKNVDERDNVGEMKETYRLIDTSSTPVNATTPSTESTPKKQRTRSRSSAAGEPSSISETQSTTPTSQAPRTPKQNSNRFLRHTTPNTARIMNLAQQEASVFDSPGAQVDGQDVPALTSPRKSQRLKAGESAIVPPPLSADHFGLVQERLASNPYHLLLATIFLNKTRGDISIPFLDTFILFYPTPESLIETATIKSIAEFMRPLGLNNVRAKRIWDMASVWVDDPPGKRVKGRCGWSRKSMYSPVDRGTVRKMRGGDGDGESGKGKGKGEEDVRDVKEGRKKYWGCILGHLPGIGAYALDSWRMFCMKPGEGGYYTENIRQKRRRSVSGVSAGKGSTVDGHEYGDTSEVDKNDGANVDGEDVEYQSDWEEGDEEWRRVDPMDKELRAYLVWKFAKEDGRGVR